MLNFLRFTFTINIMLKASHCYASTYLLNQCQTIEENAQLRKDLL